MNGGTPIVLQRPPSGRGDGLWFVEWTSVMGLSHVNLHRWTAWGLVVCVAFWFPAFASMTLAIFTTSSRFLPMMFNIEPYK